MKMEKMFSMAAAMLCCIAATAQQYTEPVKVEGGLVRGITSNGVNVYKGIPFCCSSCG